MNISPGRGGSAAAAVMSIATAALVAACSAGHSGSVTTAPGGPAASASPPAATAAASPAATSSPAATATPATDSCGAITAAQAGAALGQTVTSTRIGKAVVEGGRACVYYGPDAPPVSPDVPVADTVRVVLVTGPDAKKWFDNYRTKVKAQTISGIGDEAYYDGYASISVLLGDAYVRIAVGIADNLSAEETLARDALPNM